MNKMTFGLSAEKATVAKDTIASAIQILIHLLIDISRPSGLLPGLTFVPALNPILISVSAMRRSFLRATRARPERQEFA
jgi:hypothetical protein